MNKSELIKEIANKADLPVSTSGKALDALLATIQETIVAGDDITLVGFGTFGTKQRSARTGRNPQNGQEIEIPAATLPSFKPGKGLKDAVNK